MAVPAIDQVIDTIKEVVENAQKNNHLLLDLSQAIVTKVNELERRIDGIEKRIDQGEDILMTHQSKIHELRTQLDELISEGLTQLDELRVQLETLKSKID